jgi:hypothetical protein
VKREKNGKVCGVGCYWCVAGEVLWIYSMVPSCSSGAAIA